jgi:hypothetical protein
MNAKHFSEGRLKIPLCSQPPNLVHLLLGKFGVPVILPAVRAVIVPPALHFILCIVGRCTQAQMLGINTRGIVAAMKDVQTISNVAIGKNVTDAWLALCLSFEMLVPVPQAVFRS